MTSPRNLQPHRAALAPSFMEFDMSMEGYGYDSLCIFKIYLINFPMPQMSYVDYKIVVPTSFHLSSELCLGRAHPIY